MLAGVGAFCTFMSGASPMRTAGRRRSSVCHRHLPSAQSRRQTALGRPIDIRWRHSIVRSRITHDLPHERDTFLTPSLAPRSCWSRSGSHCAVSSQLRAETPARQVAEWVILMGGSVRLEGRMAIRELTNYAGRLSSRDGGPRGLTQSPDLQRLSGLTRLKSLNLPGPMW